MNIKSLFINSNFSIAIFLDFSEPYNCVWRNLILKKKNTHETVADGNLANIIKNFLTSRYIHVRICNSLSKYEQSPTECFKDRP